MALPALNYNDQGLISVVAQDAGKSYTKSLLDKGAPKIDEKVREEAAELGQALMNESDERVASEAGDVIYHLPRRPRAARGFTPGLAERAVAPIRPVRARREGVALAG